MREIWSICVVVCWGSLLLLVTGCISQAAEVPAIALVALDDETAGIFESDPPSPLDYAVFLLNLKAHQPRSVAVVPLWQWPGADPAAIDVLSKQASGLTVYYMALLDNESAVDDLSATLEAFPRGLKVSGDRSALPRFRSVARLPEPSLLEDGRVGFVHVDFGVDARVTPEGILVPMIAMGPDEEILPALPLVIATEGLGVPWESVNLIPGESLQLGEDSAAIEVDTSGNVRVPLERPDGMLTLSGESLLSSGEFAQGTGNAVKDAIVVFGDDRPAAKLFELPNKERLSRAELVTWTALHLVRSSVIVPQTEPDPIIESVPEPKPKIARQPIAYQFTDLRALNIGVWILGIVWGMVVGLVLLFSRSSRSDASTPQKETKPEPIAESKPTVAAVPEKKVDSKPKPAKKGEGKRKEDKREEKTVPEKNVDSENSAHLAQKKRARRRRQSRKRR